MPVNLIKFTFPEGTVRCTRCGFRAAPASPSLEVDPVCAICVTELGKYGDPAPATIEDCGHLILFALFALEIDPTGDRAAWDCTHPSHGLGGMRITIDPVYGNYRPKVSLIHWKREARNLTW